MIIREQSAIRRFLVIHNKVLRAPKHRVQGNQSHPNHHWNDDVEPHMGQDQSQHRNQPKNNHNNPVSDSKAKDLEGLVTWEVENEPRGKDDQEDDDGDRVVYEAEEEHDQEDQGVVRAEMGQVLGQSGRDLREIGGEAECGRLQELPPWPKRGNRWLAHFLHLGHQSGGHCERGSSKAFDFGGEC